MAKISIEDTENNANRTGRLPQKIERILWQAAITAKDRLGPAGDFIEVIKITPVYCDSPPTVSVKMVIVNPNGIQGKPTRIEKGFIEVCNGNVSNSLPHKIVLAFQSAISEYVQAVSQQAELFRTILTNLGQREEESGNSLRCATCGLLQIKAYDDGPLVCGKCNPLCPKCHRVSAKIGNSFGCPHCGTNLTEMSDEGRNHTHSETVSGPCFGTNNKCPNCGQIGVRNGTCFKCLACDETFGCS